MVFFFLCADDILRVSHSIQLKTFVRLKLFLFYYFCFVRCSLFSLRLMLLFLSQRFDLVSFHIHYSKSDNYCIGNYRYDPRECVSFSLPLSLPLSTFFILFILFFNFFCMQRSSFVQSIQQ